MLSIKNFGTSNKLSFNTKTANVATPRSANFTLTKRFSSNFAGNRSLKEVDPETFDIIQKEQKRQKECIELIASENFASTAVREALGSCMTNKYSEGYPGARYYAGNQYIDENEKLCQKRALQAFHLDPEKWGVNVQPLSGSPANFEAYTAVLRPHDRIMGLDLPHGGHAQKTGYIDYEKLEENASLFRPNLIIAGASAYPREYNYKKMREIADQNGAFLLSDIAHISGLIVAQVTADPFEHSDIVTTTTHKTLRGPRAGMIFYRKGSRNLPDGKEFKYELEEKINSAVFPALQGGPHNNTIAAISVALKEAMSPEFKQYQAQVKKNAVKLAQCLTSKGYTLVSGGTDNHLMLLDLRPKGIDGARVDALLEKCNITLNKNAVPGDTKPMVPGGVRIGTPAMTTRGLVEKDFEKVADFIDRGINIALQINKEGDNSSKLKSFKTAIETKEYPEIKALAKEINEFARQFPMP